MDFAELCRMLKDWDFVRCRRDEALSNVNATKKLLLQREQELQIEEDRLEKEENKIRGFLK